MIIFKYDIEKIKYDRVHNVFTDLKKDFPDEKIICIPYGLDVLTDCTLDELYRFRKDLDDIIVEKETTI